MKAIQYLLGLMSLLVLTAATPRTLDDYYSQYVGRACKALHDAPVRAMSSIGFTENGDLELHCGLHFYRVHWEAYDPWQKG